MPKPKTSDDLREQVKNDLADLKTEGASTLGFQVLNPIIDATKQDLKFQKRSEDEPASLREQGLTDIEKTVSDKEQSEVERLEAEIKRLKEMLISRVNVDTQINTNFDQQMASLKAARVAAPELRILPTENHKLSLNKNMWNLKKNVPIFVPAEAAKRAVNAKVATLI